MLSLVETLATKQIAIRRKANTRQLCINQSPTRFCATADGGISSMRRRGVGIGAVRKKQEQTKQFSEVGEQIVESNLSHVSSQLEVFRTNLQAFAIKYKNNIKKDPAFRRKFQVMCAKIGVDPLASKKGFWSELLDVGDFYYELAVQIIEIGIVTRPKNGGLIGMSDLLRLLEKKRRATMQTVTDDDVKRAVKKLSVLGEGFQLLDMEKRTMVSYCC